MRRILFIIFIAAIQIAYSQSDTDPFLVGRANMSTGNYELAIETFNQLIASSPNNMDAVFQRGMSFYKTKQYNSAIDDFLFVNKRSPGKASLMLAKCESRLNHPALAVKFLREHLGSAYKMSEKEILLDDDLMQIEATSHWKNLWKEKEWYNTYDQQLQEALYKKSIKDYPDALNILNDLDERGYKRSLVKMHLAEIYKFTGNTNAAKNELNMSVTRDYRNTRALMMRIELYIEFEEFEEAAKDCERLLRLSPDEFTYYLTYARVLSETGQFEKAIKNAEKYLSLFPEADEAYYELGYTSFRNKKYLNAISYLNKAIEKESGKAPYYFNRGRSYAATGMHKYADKDYSMALDLDPTDPEIWFMKGISDIEQDNMGKACHEFKNALQYGKKEALDYIQRICN